MEKWRLQSSPAQDLLNGASPVSSRQAAHYIPVEFTLCPSFFWWNIFHTRECQGFCIWKIPSGKKQENTQSPRHFDTWLFIIHELIVWWHELLALVHVNLWCNTFMCIIRQLLATKLKATLNTIRKENQATIQMILYPKSLQLKSSPLPLFPRAELLTWFSRPTTKCICFAVFLSQLIVFVARTYAHHLLSISHGPTAQLFADNILLVTKTKTRRHYLDDERLS